MASLNIVIVAGNVTKEIELKHLQSGMATASFSIAINHSYVSQGVKKEEVDFIPIVVWGKTAENCSKYLCKGSPVLVEGRLKQQTWDDKTSGEKKSVIKIVASNVQFLGKKNDGVGHDQPMLQEAQDDDVPF